MLTAFYRFLAYGKKDKGARMPSFLAKLREVNNVRTSIATVGTMSRVNI